MIFQGIDKMFEGDFLFILDYIKKDGKLLDLGCGNGRMNKLIQNLDVDYTGIDISANLINEARKTYPQAKFMIGSALNLAFLDESFDIIISIAVLHHIPSNRLRQKFLKEAKRVLKQNGRLILMV